MNIVHKLDESLSNQIAAGEVVERPAAVVKELVENAIDAGARRIEIELEDGGKRRIVVSDDGKGMSREDALLALERHTTSKLRTHEDLFDIHTFGFRGEAIPSIASVSRFTLTTRREQDLAACRIEVEGGKVLEVSETGAPVGTRIEVDDLFFNVPARQKFLKTRSTEVGHISEWLTRLAMCEPEIGFVLKEGQRMLLRADAAGSLKERVVALLGRDYHDVLFPVDTEHDGIRVHGLIAGPKKSSGHTRDIYTFVNGRFFRDRGINFSVVRGYEGVLQVGRSPHAILFIDLDPHLVDVNVHPQKIEVRFSDARKVGSAVVRAIRPVLAESPWNVPEKMAPTRHYSLKSGGPASSAHPEPAGGTPEGGRVSGDVSGDVSRETTGFASAALGTSLQDDPRLASGSQSPGQRFADALFGGAVGSSLEGEGAAQAPAAPGEHTQRIAQAASGWLGPAPDLGEVISVSDSERAEEEAKASDALLKELEEEPGLQIGGRLGGRLQQALEAMKRQGPTEGNSSGADSRGVSGTFAGQEGAGSFESSDGAGKANGGGARGLHQGQLLSGDAGTHSQQEQAAPDTLRFSELRYLGQILRTFLVCESPQGLVLLDQHAAHERVLYEQLRARQSEEKPRSTSLLIPRTIHLSAAESAQLEGVLDELTQLGFELEDFGGNSWALKAYPSDIEEKNLEELVRELVLEIENFGAGLSREQSKEALLVRTSCHSALRSGDLMEPQEVQALLKSLDGVPFNAQCPHGRPVSVVFDARQLDLMFRRDYEGTPKGAVRDRLGC